MKRICEDDQVSGLEALLGETVLLMCANYFYSGVVVSVGDEEIELSDAGIVYETGPWSEKGFKDRQVLPSNIHIRLFAVESYCEIS